MRYVKQAWRPSNTKPIKSRTFGQIVFKPDTKQKHRVPETCCASTSLMENIISKYSFTVLSCKMLLVWCVLVHVFVYKYGNCQKWTKPVVNIKQGPIEGDTIYTDSSKIANRYLGIPYAAAPVNDLRFSPPQKHSGWNNTYKADKIRSKCPQLPLVKGVTDNEDCLYLNIWTPSNTAHYAPLPVLVFIEGTDFSTSSDLEISGQDLAVEGLVVVTLNYRLNVFGFFCLGNSKSRGNLGLLDQYFALLWIKENIQRFGGDPEKITLFGYFSGGVSVLLHMVSPRTPGLFKRAIVSSGSILTPWQIQNDPVAASKEILRILGCNVYTTDYIGCLRSKKVEDILQALQEYSESHNWNDRFLPMVDSFLPENNRYLPSEPSEILKTGKFLYQIPIMTGITKPVTHPQINEWIELASQGSPQLLQYLEKAKIPEILRLYKFTDENKDDIFEIIKWKYETRTKNDVKLLIDQIRYLEFDAKIEAPHFLQLSHLTSSYVQPIFVYYFDEIDLLLNTTDNLATTDMLLLFGPALLKQTGRRKFNSEETRISNLLKQMWINFVIFGNPTPNGNRVKPWRKYTAEDPYVENFVQSRENSEGLSMKITESVAFWNQLLPKIAKHSSNISNYIPRELQNSPDPAAGFRHAMYTLVGLVIALLALLLICIVLLKKRSRERERQLHLGF